MLSDFNFTVFVFSIVVVLLTPGPTNTLLATAGLQQGLRKALPLIAFELSGYLIAISAWGMALTPMQHDSPWLATSVRAASSIYLAYIAIKVWRSSRVLSTSGERSIRPKDLFVATLLNPKGLLFSSVIFPPHAFDNIQVYSAAMALFSSLLVPIAVIWIRFGAVLGSGRLNPVNLQRTAALALGVFSASIAWAAFH